jgi:hypothetical protein
MRILLHLIAVTASDLTDLNPKERIPGTHWTGGWVGPRTDMNTEATQNTLASAGDQTWMAVIQSVARHYTD